MIFYKHDNLLDGTVNINTELAVDNEDYVCLRKM